MRASLRFRFHLLAAFCAPLLFLPWVAMAKEGERPEDIPERLVNPEGMVDRMVDFDTPEEWLQGELTDVDVITSMSPHRLMLGEPEPEFPRAGRWESAEVETDFPFTELLPSWNALTPAGTGFTFKVRTRDAQSGEWSPWLYLGQWGRTLHWPSRTLWFEGEDGSAGAINTDFLLLRRPAGAFQVRVDFFTYDPEGIARPMLRRFNVAYAGVVEDAERRAALLGDSLAAQPGPSPGKAISLDVPYFGNEMTGEAMDGYTCSPSSITMVMAYHGVERPLLENCAAIFDPEYGIFGAWPRNVARAAEFGLDGYVARMRSWAQVRQELERGNPIVASIRFGKGEFPSNVLEETTGHLLVIRGLTAEGDPIVNDPASLERGHGIVYKADELANAWFAKGGASYIIRKPPPAAALAGDSDAGN